MTEIVLTGALVFTDVGEQQTDVSISGGEIEAFGPVAGTGGAHVIDCRGCWIGPGLVDLHAHLREPGEEWKENISSGSEAAAAGGYTAVVAMPNTTPPVDSGHMARFVADRGRQENLVEVSPAGAISLALAGDRLAHLDELLEAGVRLFTDDGRPVSDSGLMRQAMEYLADRGAVIANHAEDLGLSRNGHMHEGEVSSLLGMGGIPALAEEAMVARDLALAELTGAPYHVQHVSSRGTVALVDEAKKAGICVTAEVTPQHLSFDETDVAAADPTYKMYPPLRTEADRSALRKALLDGVIDAVATDHAPHAEHEKEVPFEEAPPGVIGLETAAGAVLTALDPDPRVFFDRMSVAPARIGRLPSQGRWPAIGEQANLAVIDPQSVWEVEPRLSRSSNSPFLGRTISGAVKATIFEGRLTWLDGKIVR